MRQRASLKRLRQSRRSIRKQRNSHRQHGGNTDMFDSNTIEMKVRNIIDSDHFPSEQRELIQHYPHLMNAINTSVSEMLMSKQSTYKSSKPVAHNIDTDIKSTIQYVLKGFILARERAKTIANLIIDKRERKESRSAFGQLTHSLKKRISGTRSGKTLRELEQKLEELVPNKIARENLIQNERERRTIEKHVAESIRISEILSKPLGSSASYTSRYPQRRSRR
jgi:hypothetical protein